MATITLIQSPHPFAAHFFKKNEETADKPPFLTRVAEVAQTFFKWIALFFTALGKALYLTFSHTWTSFKHIVLGYYGSMRNFRPPSDIYLAVFKIIFWLASLGWCLLTTFFRLLYEALHDKSSNQTLLQAFAPPEMDIAHITTSELAIDVSKVPEEVTVDNLLEMYDAINFYDPNSPNYMAQSNLKDEDGHYTKEKLKKSLETFVHNVSQRVAFLGTPPAYDTPRLMKFYQQIENAVRFSIHKAQKDLEKFQNIHGTDPGNYQEPVLKEYKNLLETKARIALDLAIAGRHCGARYMAESMALYNLHSENFEKPGSAEPTLKENLIECLAKKRKEIAERQIYEEAKSHPILGEMDPFSIDVHPYDNYMANLGHILAIPGTKDVIEHLSSSFDRRLHLQRFFEEYTVDFILDAIQEELRQSKKLRHQVIDWVKEQAGDWGKEADEKTLNSLVNDVEDILKKEVIEEDFAPYQNFLCLQDLVRFLDEEEIENIDEEEFAFEIFNLDKAKEWCKKNLLHKDRLENLRKRKAIQDLFSKDQLGEKLVEKVKEKQLDVEYFLQDLLTLQRKNALTKLVQQHPLMQENASPMENFLIDQVIKGEKSFKEAFMQSRGYARNRGTDFVYALGLYKKPKDSEIEIEKEIEKGLLEKEKEELSEEEQELLEKLLVWIAVDHGILRLPQEFV